MPDAQLKVSYGQDPSRQVTFLDLVAFIFVLPMLTIQLESVMDARN